jgi:hypothetical protein
MIATQRRGPGTAVNLAVPGDVPVFMCTSRPKQSAAAAIGRRFLACGLGRPRSIGPGRLEQRPAEAAEVPMACTLSGDGQRARASEWAELLDQATRRTPVTGGVNVTFPADPALVGRLASLTAREKQCCAFFAFTLDMTAAGSVTLQVRAPQQAQSLVAELLGDS